MHHPEYATDVHVETSRNCGAFSERKTRLYSSDATTRWISSPFCDGSAAFLGRNETRWVDKWIGSSNAGSHLDVLLIWGILEHCIYHPRTLAQMQKIEEGSVKKVKSIQILKFGEALLIASACWK